MFGVGVGIRVGGFTPSGGAAPYVGLLDSYPGAAAAYSVRLLKSDYTGSAIRVRRSSDNAESDIGFSGGNLDTSALTTFCGAGNGFVTTWYDQSGNARNATQTTAANQPQIVNSGSIINVNSKPSMQFDGSNDILNLTYQWANSTFDSFNVIYPKSSTAYQGLFTEGGASNGFLSLALSGTAKFAIFNAGNFASDFTSSYSINTQYLGNYYATGISGSADITCKFRKNNGSEESAYASGLSTNNQTIIGGAGSGDRYNGIMQELILYSSNKSSDRTGISNNINTYYGIY